MGTPAIEIALLGRFEVRRDGAPVPRSAYGGRQAQRLVRVLAVQAGSLVTRDALIEALWDDHLPSDPDANLNVVVTRARGALGSAAVIETRQGGYVLHGDVVVDTVRFEDAARASATVSAPDESLAAHRTALALWTGEPLVEDRYEDWAAPVRDRLSQLRQDLLERGAEAALAVGDAETAAAWAREASRQQPLREAGSLLLVRALAACGDPAAALVEYDALRTRLADELGVDPSPAARELHARLLAHEGVARRRTPAGPAPFVGRGRELARLRRTSLPGSVVVVRGPAGMGKSRLIAELRAGTGHPSLHARAVQPEQSTPWSLARRLARAALDLAADPALLPGRVLSAVAEVVPEIEEAPGPALDAESRRVLVLDGVRRLVTGCGAPLVVVDDLQWADASSLELLAVLAAEPGVALLLSCRSGERLSGPVAATLDRLRGIPGCTEVSVAPLARDDIELLVSEPEVAAVVSELTDGTPFEVLAVLDELTRSGVLRREPDGWVREETASTPVAAARAAALDGRRSAVASRLAGQSSAGRRLVGLLALLDRPAPVDLLTRSSGVADPERELEPLADAGLLRHGRAGWSCSHDLVAETVREQLGPGERAALHSALATAIDPTSAAERAHHLAGAGEPGAAAVAYGTAAAARLEACAEEEAAALCETGLGLQQDDESRRALLEVRAEVRRRAGERGGARSDLRQALALARTAEDRSRLLAALAQLASGGDDMARAEQLAELALVEAGAVPLARAHALRVAAIVDMNRDRPERAEERYDEAVRLFREAGDAAGVVEVLDAQTMASFMRGEVATATDDLARVAGIFEDLGRLFRVVQPLSTAGHGLVFQDRAGAGFALAERALELARSLGDREGTAYALWHGSEALSALGEVTRASDAAEEALAIATEIGHRGWTATAHRALGVAALTAGDLDVAERSFRSSLEASEGLALFASWARSRLAMVANARGRHAAARELADDALRIGPPLAHHEGRLAAAEAALGLGSPDAADRVRAALAGERAGFRVGLAALRRVGLD